MSRGECGDDPAGSGAGQSDWNQADTDGTEVVDFESTADANIDADIDANIDANIDDGLPDYLRRPLVTVADDHDFGAVSWSSRGSDTVGNQSVEPNRASDYNLTVGQTGPGSHDPSHGAAAYDDARTDPDDEWNADGVEVAIVETSDVVPTDRSVAELADLGRASHTRTSVERTTVERTTVERTTAEGVAFGDAQATPFMPTPRTGSAAEKRREIAQATAGAGSEDGGADAAGPVTDVAVTDVMVADLTDDRGDEVVAVGVVQSEVAQSDAATGVVATQPPPGDLSPNSQVDQAYVDGSRRRRTALIVVGAALLAGILGMVIGSLIQSPADRAASRSAPTPSLIVVPVERQVLTSELTLNGEVTYDEPTAVQLAGSVNIEADETAVVTRAPEVAQTVKEGEALLEVTGRPVFVLQGSIPMYRKIEVGISGPDVAQLEVALDRLKLKPGKVDDTADADTMAAVDRLYAQSGFDPAGPTGVQSEELDAAVAAVNSAKQQVNSAKTQLETASNPLKSSERIQLERAVAEANAAIPTAQQGVSNVTAEQDTLVNTAVADRDNAKGALATVEQQLQSAKSGAVNPETGAPYTALDIAQLAGQVAEAQSAVAQASAAIDSATRARTSAIAEANAAVEAARYQLQLAQVQYKEGTAGVDTSAEKEGVSDANTQLEQAQKQLEKAQAAAGTRVPAGELIFVPALPAEVTEWSTPVGSPATGAMGSIATTQTNITARISRSDSSLVKPGAAVQVEIRDAGVTIDGIVDSVGPPKAQGGSADLGGESDGRLQVVVVPAEGTDGLAEYVGYSAKVVVGVESTEEEQLVVPVAALSVGPDGGDRVQVERTPATDDQPAVIDDVPVAVGLTANGLAAVVPTKGGLDVGDNVVIGVDAGSTDSADETDESDESDSNAAGVGGSGSAQLALTPITLPYPPVQTNF